VTVVIGPVDELGLVMVSQREERRPPGDDQTSAVLRVFCSPQAGDSGADMVVLPGLDTIDVSTVYTSLLGIRTTATASQSSPTCTSSGDLGYSLSAASACCA
jgi:hypothetical protein